MPAGLAVIALLAALTLMAFVEPPDLSVPAQMEEAALNPDCPVQDSAFVPESGSVCWGRLGANFAIAFYYPREAARYPRWTAYCVPQWRRGGRRTTVFAA